MFTNGLRKSIKASIVPFKRQSKRLPSSFITLHSTVTFHTYLPVTMQRDSGSRAFEPTITVSSNLVTSAETFLFCSCEP